MKQKIKKLLRKLDSPWICIPFFFVPWALALWWCLMNPLP